MATTDTGTPGEVSADVAEAMGKGFRVEKVGKATSWGSWSSKIELSRGF